MRRQKQQLHNPGLGFGTRQPLAHVSSFRSLVSRPGPTSLALSLSRCIAAHERPLETCYNRPAFCPLDLISHPWVLTPFVWLVVHATARSGKASRLETFSPSCRPSIHLPVCNAAGSKGESCMMLHDDKAVAHPGAKLI